MSSIIINSHNDTIDFVLSDFFVFFVFPVFQNFFSFGFVQQQHIDNNIIYRSNTHVYQCVCCQLSHKKSPSICSLIYKKIWKLKFVESFFERSLNVCNNTYPTLSYLNASIDGYFFLRTSYTQFFLSFSENLSLPVSENSMEHSSQLN